MKHYLIGMALALAGLLFTAGRANAQVAGSTAIVSKLTGQCWDAQFNSVDDGAVIWYWPCTGTSNQSWVFQVYSFVGDSPQARIVNVHSGMCAAVESADPTSGSIGLRQHVCNVNDPLQQFTIEAPVQSITVGTQTFPAPLLARHIVSVATHWCLKTDASFNRPFEVAGCGTINDQSTRFNMVGI